MRRSPLIDAAAVATRDQLSTRLGDEVSSSSACRTAPITASTMSAPASGMLFRRRVTVDRDPEQPWSPRNTEVTAEDAAAGLDRLRYGSSRREGWSRSRLPIARSALRLDARAGASASVSSLPRVRRRDRSSPEQQRGTRQVMAPDGPFVPSLGDSNVCVMPALRQRRRSA